jgi:hypothetical protein
VSYADLLAQELHSFLDPATGLLAAAHSRIVACPLCGEAPDGQRELFLKRGYRFVACPACGLVFVNPMLRESAGLPLYDGAGSVAEWARVVQTDGQREFDLSLYGALMGFLWGGMPG